MVFSGGIRFQLRALRNSFSVVSDLPKMGLLENAKKVAAYKAVDEYVKVTYSLR